MDRIRTPISAISTSLARITMRLRIALMLVVIVTAIAGGSVINKARTLLSSYTSYQSTAQPMLDLAQHIRQDVSDMALLLENMTALRHDRDLVDLTRVLSFHRDRINRNLADLAALGGDPALLKELNSQLEAGHQSVLGAIAEHSKFLQTEERLETIIVEVLALQGRGHRILENMNFLITSETDNLVRQGLVADLALVPERNERLAALFQYTLNLNEISFSLDSVLNAVLTMRDLGGSDASLRPSFLAQEELRSVISTLAQFPDSDNRRALATVFSDIRLLITAESGFFELQRRQFALSQEAEAIRTDYIPLLSETSAMADRLFAEMLATSEGAAEDLGTALENLVWVLTVTFCFAVVTILVTNHLIIERQFSRRMAQLTRSTRAIARGELSHPVMINGSDELGEMADALRVFRANAEDLKRSNEELEKFAYVAAHDLRAPLRAVSDLATWIREDEDNEMSAESLSYLTILQERIKRLDRLLQDLLSYARAGTAIPDREWISLEATCREQFRLSDPESCMRLMFDGPDVMVLLESTAFRQILANLFVNAQRHHDRPKGMISVRARTDPGSLTVEVEDDGPGIPLKYQQKVFELFQTLRPRDDLEGSGLGLAIIRKLIDRQEGEITLISNPDERRGTLFRITLPLTEPAKPVLAKSDCAA